MSQAVAFVAVVIAIVVVIYAWKMDVKVNKKLLEMMEREEEKNGISSNNNDNTVYVYHTYIDNGIPESVGKKGKKSK